MTKVTGSYLRKEARKQMKKTLSDRTLRASTLSLLFLISGIGASVLVNPASAAPNSAAPRAAAPSGAAPAALSQAEANWQYPGGNAFNQDYNPVNQINSSNAQYLGLSWLYALPSLPTSLVPASNTAFNGVTVDMQILVVNGTAYAINNFDEVFAFNVANGNTLWTATTPLNSNESIPGAGLDLCLLPPCDPQIDNHGLLVLHHHDGNEWFTSATIGSTITGPTLWYQGADRKVYAINALTGKQVLNFTTFEGLGMVPGNSPTSLYHSDGPANIVIDQKRGILITSIDAETASNNGRGYYSAWNLKVNPPTLMWLAYTTPPQPGGNVPVDPNWAMKSVNNMSGAYIFDPGKGAANGYTTSTELQGGLMVNTNDNMVLNLKTMSSTALNATLYNDWGQVGQSTQCQAITGGSSTGSTGAAWGGPWLLGSGPTDGILFAGTNNKDPFVGPCNPGPDLWSASVLALNITNGHWIWGLQTTTHDIWDYDCSWWQAAGNETIAGKVTPVVFKTCKNGFLYEINAFTGDIIWAWVPPTNLVPRCPICWPMDPTNKTQTSFDFPTAFNTFKSGKPTTGPQPPFLQYPSELAGFEDVQSYNPNTNTLYVASHIVPYFMYYDGLNASLYFNYIGEHGTPVNYPNPQIPSDNINNNNSTIWSINAATGAVNWKYFIPIQGYRGGVSSSGNLVFGTLSSGDLLMINAQTGKLVRDLYIGAPMDVAASVGASINGQEFVMVPVGTCSLEAVVTCPGSTPGDIVALSLQNATANSAVSPPGGGGGASTTVSVSTTTVTASGGFGATTVYGLAAVAVIFIIATGYLAMRGRKPAS